MTLRDKVFNPRTYYNFKSLAVLLYFIITIVALLGMSLYVVPEEVKQACIEKARRESTGFMFLPIYCYIHPFTWILIYLNLPGIMFTDFFSSNQPLSNFLASLPNQLEYFLSKASVVVLFIVSIGTYIFSGHIIDLLVRFLFHRKKT